VLGTRVTGIAYPLLVLDLTQSPAKAGLVGFAQSLRSCSSISLPARLSTGGTGSA